VTDYTLTWYNHIDHLISRLNPVCYAERAVKAMLSRKALRMPHFSYVHSIISYGIIFWGNTPNSIKIFRMQNKKRERERERERERLIRRKWIRVKDYLKQQKFHISVISIYFLFYGIW